MRRPKDNIPVEILYDLLEYVPDTGVLYWKHRPDSFFPSQKAAIAWNARNAGKVAGALHPSGYVYISIFRSKYMAHRLGFALYHGRYPEGMIDHINQNKSNNRLENFREVSAAESVKNRPLFATNKSGVCGVFFLQKKNKWRAQIGYSNSVIQLGEFKKFEDAVSKRKQAEIDLGFHPNHGGN